MSKIKLFEKEQVIGIFRGFSQGGLEFHADLVLPYRSDFQSTPMHGLFLLVQLEHEREAVLGRITSFHSDGRLASGSGEDYGIRAVLDEREIPDDLREQYLKYRVNIRVLGVVRVRTGDDRKDAIVFAPSHRRLPHVGSKVARLSPLVLQVIAGHHDAGVELGFYALGEFVYSGQDRRLRAEDWMRVVEPAVVPRFDIRHLVSRRSFIFARAGYGKSNLNKLLFSALYGDSEVPTIKKAGRDAPVGTVLFDPDGEYFWPDDNGRPGLCDVASLERRLVVFTSRRPPSAFYGSFVAGPVKLDIRRLRPSEVVSIALSPEKQDQQNVHKLRSMAQHDWARLVDEVTKSKNQTDLDFVKECLHIRDGGEVEAIAALSNMTRIVTMLHDPTSRMLDALLAALRAGSLCVVDVSQLRGEAGFILSGMILQWIFEHNQHHFTAGSGQTIPTLAVVEEAQSVLGAGNASSAMRPYIEWVKEGRKYDLGAVLVTQRPGSISDEILSQGDNWFIFHLLSARDLSALKDANAHFSPDLLSSLLNEPIKGHGIFWSSENPRPIPIPVRVLEFGKLHHVLDPNKDRLIGNTWAVQYKQNIGHTSPDRQQASSSAEDSVIEAPQAEPVPNAGSPSSLTPIPRDEFTDACQAAMDALGRNGKIMEQLRNDGVKWGRLYYVLLEALPSSFEGREDIANGLVKRFLEEKFGPERVAWCTQADENRKQIVKLIK